jgi:hypothetical protein
MSFSGKPGGSSWEYLVTQKTKIEKSGNLNSDNHATASINSYSLKICFLLMSEIKKLLSLQAIFKQHNV